MRKYPNIIITGTPGVGKTTTATYLIELANTDTTADSSSSSSTTDNKTQIPLKHISINAIAKQHDLYESYDAELDTHVVDEEKLLDHVEQLISDGSGDGGWVIDWHVCDIFPERWVDLVVVLRCPDTQVFYERLTKGGGGTGSTGGAQNGEGKENGESRETGRGYTGKKLEENVDAEIFGVIAEEAREAWPQEGQVVELNSVEAEDLESNAERIWEWCQQWMNDNIEVNG